MSGSIMYQQGMGGIMGPPCSPAHDEYSNPDPMVPKWPRGPPPHNPVFNSHMAPQNEHIYRPKVKLLFWHEKSLLNLNSYVNFF